MGQSALVTGAGGFIGHHLVQYLVDKGYHVRGADIKRPEYAPTAAQEFEALDLRRFEDCLIAARGVDEVYHLAADMGGIGYITENHADVARNNVLIEANMLEAARIHGAQRFFYSSSACVYPLYLQEQPDVTPLKESDAYPADAEPGYGWEKLYGELLCRYYRGDHGLETRVARFHNIYGPEGTYDGGREKAPAAICRKVALARDGDEIEVWGDGEQTRSFTYISDCVEGIYRIAQSDYPEPLNLGSDELTTINNLVDVVAAAAGKTLVKRHDVSKPQGVRGRNSDNAKSGEVLGLDAEHQHRRRDGGDIPLDRGVCSGWEPFRPASPDGRRRAGPGGRGRAGAGAVLRPGSLPNGEGGPLGHGVPHPGDRGMDFRVSNKPDGRAMPAAWWNVESRFVMKRPHPNNQACPDCGAHELMSVRLVVADSPVEFTSCQACEGRWWEREGETLTLDSVLTLVGRH